MSNLKNLVPPLELCKLIPEGEFVDSCFVRCFDNIGTVILCERENEVKTEGWRTIPAPTLQEIMAELPACDCYRFADKNEWAVLLVNGPVDDGVKSDSPATAAMKLWLNLKGIKYE